MSGRDVLALMPTGAGKSLIFQMLAYLSQEASKDENSKLIIVVMPLISLIDDNFNKC